MEKMHETRSEEEDCVKIPFIINPDLRDSNYSKYFKEGVKKTLFCELYSNQKLLNVGADNKFIKKIKKF